MRTPVGAREESSQLYRKGKGGRRKLLLGNSRMTRDKRAFQASEMALGKIIKFEYMGDFRIFPWMDEY